MYAFNSHWNYEHFTKFFDLPTERCVVIKNGIDNIKPREEVYKLKDEKCRIIHHCTPWRGLNVLLGAMQLVKSNVTLDVYSSCEVYGKDFAEKNDSQYQGLYDQAKQLKNVNYIGYKPNSYIKVYLKGLSDVCLSKYMGGDFCISAIESMYRVFIVCPRTLSSL